MKPGKRKIGRRIFNWTIKLSLASASSCALYLWLWIAICWFSPRTLTIAGTSVTFVDGGLVVQHGLYFDLTNPNLVYSLYNPTTFTLQPPGRSILVRSWRLGGIGFLSVPSSSPKLWMLSIPLIYPVVLSLMLFIIVFACRQRRSRPGICARCDYDLRASKESCPECGEPIPPSMANIEE
ncbi:MAG: hypothetical protein NTW19_09540 [Planctomycetota bacterium]|nr:hypothetical protein [Planctomycetota bacterium]